jgi:hypothetical protein
MGLSVAAGLHPAAVNIELVQMFHETLSRKNETQKVGRKRPATNRKLEANNRTLKVTS